MEQQIFGAKRNKLRYSKAFQKQRGTNSFVPTKNRIEEEQIEVFQSFPGTKRNERICSKKIPI